MEHPQHLTGGPDSKTTLPAYRKLDSKLSRHKIHIVVKAAKALKRRILMKMLNVLFVLVAFMLGVNSAAWAQDKAESSVKQVQLPQPQMEIGIPLMKALMLRQTNRAFDVRALSPQELSNLLWAADGVNRPSSGKRTAPTAMNCQEIDVYISKADGLYRYNAQNNSLELISPKDIRELTGSQPFVKTAPVNLILVADWSKMPKGNDDSRTIYTAMDAGYVSQNIYLYCASQGLATVVRGNVNKDILAKAMNLKESQKIIVAQTVGYPVK